MLKGFIGLSVMVFLLPAAADGCRCCRVARTGDRSPANRQTAMSEWRMERAPFLSAEGKVDRAGFGPGTTTGADDV